MAWNEAQELSHHARPYPVKRETCLGNASTRWCNCFRQWPHHSYPCLETWEISPLTCSVINADEMYAVTQTDALSHAENAENSQVRYSHQRIFTQGYPSWSSISGETTPVTHDLQLRLTSRGQISYILPPACRRRGCEWPHRSTL